MKPPSKPTKAEIQAAAGKTVPDVIAPGLDVLFCGINPGLYTAAVGHHFARPGNRFWPTLYAAGITNRLLAPFEERELLEVGYGITNLVERATAAAAELSAEELAEGGQRLAAKVQQYQPRFVAILGITAYRQSFGRRQAQMGRQPEKLGGAVLWVLPNPSGLNAHYQLDRLGQMFGDLRAAAESAPS
jgi:TDG/mug DNA glycosylase family protein